MMRPSRVPLPAVLLLAILWQVFENLAVLLPNTL